MCGQKFQKDDKTHHNFAFTRHLLCNINVAFQLLREFEPLVLHEEPSFFTTVPTCCDSLITQDDLQQKNILFLTFFTLDRSSLSFSCSRLRSFLPYNLFVLLKSSDSNENKSLPMPNIFRLNRSFI